MYKVRFMPAAAAALGAILRGTAPAFPNNAPRLPKPPHVEQLTPRQKRARTNLRNQRWNQDRRDERRRMRDSNTIERQRLVNKMTNWGRNQWARAGYPQALGRVRMFVGKRHWEAAE